MSERWSSAGNTRGLIEAPTRSDGTIQTPASSAGNTRGLIEAIRGVNFSITDHSVFRGEYPRPH